jgi:hypothetical protein
MSPADLTNALLYGIPLVLYTSMYQGFDSVLSRKMPMRRASTATRATLTGNCESACGGGALHISVAKSPAQLKAASELVRERYAWRGYDLGEQATPSSREITFLIESDKTTVGTLTLGVDGPHGLCAEASYGDVIAHFRKSGHRVCELMRLALAESVDSRAVLSSLFSLAHAVGRTMHDVTHVFIEVNPRHVTFYSRMLGFMVEASGKLCERVHAPSTLMQVEIEALERRLGLADWAGQMQPLAEAA